MRTQWSLSSTKEQTLPLFPKIFRTLEISSLPSIDTNVTGAGSQPLQVCGKFEADLQNKARSSRQTVYVVSTLSKALLGKPAIESLNLITRIDSVEKDSCRARYPELFTGLGSLGRIQNQVEANKQHFVCSHCTHTSSTSTDAKS